MKISTILMMPVYLNISINILPKINQISLETLLLQNLFHIYNNIHISNQTFRNL